MRDPVQSTFAKMPFLGLSFLKIEIQTLHFLFKCQQFDELQNVVA